MTWKPVAGSAADPGAQPQVAGVAAVNGGFVLLRPATVAKRPAVDAFYSPNGVAWTFQSTLSAAAGFTAGMVNGGPDGAAVTGQTGAAGAAWRVADRVRHVERQGPGGRPARSARPGLKRSPAWPWPRTAPWSPRASARARTAASRCSSWPGPAAIPERVDIAKIPGAVEAQVAVNAVAAQGSTQVAVGSANGFPAVWTSANGGSSWNRATGASPAVLGRPGTQQLTSVTHGPMGWLAVGGVTASAAEHPVVVVSADAASWQAADGERAFTGPGLFTQAAAANSRGLVIVGYQKIKQVRDGRVVSVRTVAAAWWSASLTGWQRGRGRVGGRAGRRRWPADAGRHGRPGRLRGGGRARPASRRPGPRPTAGAGGRWTCPSRSARPGPCSSTSRASAGPWPPWAPPSPPRASTVPFAASSANGGVSWAESALPDPAGLTSVTALTAAGRTFTATGTYGSTPGHQNVVVWTSPNGSAWHAAEPAGQGLTGPGIQAITSLTASGNTLTGVGFSASPNAEQPVFWQAPVR